MRTALLALVIAAVPALKFDTPAGWVAKTPSSAMRVAEFTLAKVTGDAEDASAVLYFFSGSGGSVQENLDRWIGQVTQPDGKASKDVAKTATFTSRGLSITTVDVSGTYVAEMSPGATERFNKPNFRVIAAVVTTPGGPYYLKVTGPAKTVAKWNDSVTAFLKSLRVE